MFDRLEVHHTYYERGRDPWDYPINSLVTLCYACHGEVERLIKRGFSFTRTSIRKSDYYTARMYKKKPRIIGDIIDEVMVDLRKMYDK
jgi:hypothetical protein